MLRKGESDQRAQSSEYRVETGRKLLEVMRLSQRCLIESVAMDKRRQKLNNWGVNWNMQAGAVE
jgi:hypothetical protein